MRTDVVIRPYRSGDEERIVKLFNICFPESRDISGWKWRFQCNPAGQPLIVVAEGEGEIVGHCSYQPARFAVDGALKVGAQDCDLMVRPDHRGGQSPGRLSYRLLEALRAMASHSGWDFVFYAPNSRSRALADNPVLGGVKLWDIPQMVMPLNPFYLVHRRPAEGLLRVSRRLWGSRLLAKRPTSVKRAAAFDEGFERLWGSVKGCYRMIMIRDLPYLRWRFTSPGGEGGGGLRLDPYRLYVKLGRGGLEGYVITRVREEGGWRAGYLVDMLAQPNDTSTLRLLAKAAVAHCRESKADVIRCWMRGPFAARGVLRRLGFWPRPLDLGWRARSLDPERRGEAPIDSTGWYLTLGDGDGI